MHEKRPGSRRLAMLGMDNPGIASRRLGHIMTPRGHVCGDFIDTYDWHQPVS